MNHMNGQRLAGKRILVTAGGSGMGRAGVVMFAQQGAEVCVVDYNGDAAREVADEVKAAGGNAHALIADLTSAEEARRVVNESAELMGGLDGLWLHAGMPGPHGVEALDEAMVAKCHNLNVNSVIASVGVALPHLRKGNNPAIVMTSSTSGLVGSRHSPLYSAAKFAVIGLVKSLALTHGRENIRVNAICPGITKTPMMRDFMDDAARSKYLEVIPLGRIAKPQEIAASTLWLLSDEASYVTGVALAIDGGFTAG